MHITWLGQTAVKLQTKHGEHDVVTLIDAYKPDSGDFPRNASPDLALFSKGQTDAISVSEAFVLDTLGEIDTKDVMVSAFPGSNDSLVFSISAEGMHIVHLGRITSFDDALVARIGSVDVLLLPIGGNKQYLDAEKAAALITALEPRVIIPVAYQCDSDKNAAPLSAFLKESGLKPTTTDKKIILKKKDLPQDETRLIVLEKNA